MLRDLDEGGGSPDDGKKESGEKESLPVAEVKAGRATNGFQKHKRSDDIGHQIHVAGVIVGEGRLSESGKERVDCDLHDPDDSGHRGAGRQLNE